MNRVLNFPVEAGNSQHKSFWQSMVNGVGTPLSNSEGSINA